MITTQLINGATLGFSTFQSNNQRCVVTSYGIFVAYLTKTNNGNYTDQTFVLQQSTDSGRTFSTVYTNSCLDQNPILEADASGNLYMIFVEAYGNSRFLKFTNTDFTTPSVSTSIAIVNSQPSKHCMILDDTHNKIYYFMAEKGYFTVLNKAGTVLSLNTQLLVDGTNAFMEYPLVTLDASGTIYFAWTTQKKVDHPPVYWNLSWMKSTDSGATWTKADGTSLTLPVTCDDTGNADMINDPLDTGTGIWLCSFTYANDRLHCFYWLDGVGNKYVRVNPTTGDREITTTIISGNDPEISGLITRDTSGNASNPTPLYLTCTANNRRILKTYVSLDNGTTWTLDSEKSDLLYEHIYSICGYREQVNGKSNGIFTLLNALSNTNYTVNKGAYTYFFKT